MDKLKDLKMREFKKALSNLKASSILEYSDISRDSTLLRFELTSEILWKSLKIYLSENFQIEAIYPNDIYRQAGKIKLINIDDVELALNMISDRNRMVHDYNQEWSDELYKKILKDYIPLFERILIELEK